MNRDRRAYHVACVSVVCAVTVLCVAGAVAGIRRADEYTFYFYELRDVGHPGLVTVIAAAGLFAGGVILAVMAFATGARAWVVGSVLLLVVAVDDLLRLHNKVTGGDALVRLATWVTVVWLVVRLRSTITITITERALLGFALVAFMVSEVLDLVDDEHGLGAVAEEAAGAVGAWAVALAALGVALLTLEATSSTTEALS